MYEVILEEPAKQFIRRLDKHKQNEILNKISQLENNPRLGKPLIGKLAGFWSLRIGAYRAIYAIKDVELIVLVLKVGHRKSVYG